MKLCVYGAGAIGGLLAVRLAQAGVDVSVIARGAHLDAIRRDGLTLETDGETSTIRLPASDRPDDFGPQDYVIAALKAHQLAAAAPAFAPLLGPRTAVVTAANGIPWWYFHKHGGELEGRWLGSVDPGGRIWQTIGPERAIGCVVNPAAEVIRPGVIQHHQNWQFTIGEPNGARSDRIVALAEALTAAGFEAPIREGIRWNVWLKLWGNVCFNPISVLTAATLDRIVGEAALRFLCTTMMHEARAVTTALGIDIPARMIEERLKGAGAIGIHKMSMLQDFECGRPLEIDALVTAVQEIARLLGVPTPTIDVVLVLTAERARQAGLYAALGGSALDR